MVFKFETFIVFSEKKAAGYTSQVRRLRGSRKASAPLPAYPITPPHHQYEKDDNDPAHGPSDPDHRPVGVRLPEPGQIDLLVFGG